MFTKSEARSLLGDSNLFLSQEVVCFFKILSVKEVPYSLDFSAGTKVFCHSGIKVFCMKKEGGAQGGFLYHGI